ncbi:MAG TPA: YncE family protein [Candidatus Kryptonia bacterium]
MKKPSTFQTVVMMFIFTASVYAQTSQSTYSVVDRIHLPGETFWDYLNIDPASGNLYVSRGTMVQVVNINSKKLVGTIPDTKGVHGIALAADLDKGFVSDGADSSVTVFDMKTLSVIEKIAVTGRDPDAILYDPFTHRVFTCNGRSSNSTVIDAKTDKVIGTIPLSGGPEFCASDGAGMIYINIEDKSEIDAIDPAAMKVEHVWPLAPGESPSGLALDAKNHRLFSVCHNKEMVVLNALDGKVITALPIDGRVDGAAFDPELMRTFSSNGEGTLTVVQEVSPDSFTVIQNLQTQVSARTVTIDPVTHHLYLSAADFNPPPQATADNPRPRPSMKPNSFVVLEVAPAK